MMTGWLDRAGAAVANALRVLPAAGEPGYPSPGEIAAGPRLERQVVRVHALGPRVLAELLIEIASHTGQSIFIADRLQAYARLDPELVRAVGGDSFPPMPLTVIR